MNRCKTYKSSNAQEAAEPNGIMPIRNSRPTLCGESGTGSPQRDGCVVFVSPQTCVHLAQMGDSKRADNSDCLSYSVGSEIGNRRALQGTPVLSSVRRGQSYISAGAPPTGHHPLYDVRRGAFPCRPARPRGIGPVAGECSCRRICLVRGWGYARHKRVWWYRSSRVRPWPRCRPVRPGLSGSARSGCVTCESTDPPAVLH